MISLVRGICAVGESVVAMGKESYTLFGLCYDTIIAAVQGARRGYRSLLNQIVNQILFTGVEAFPLVGVIALVCGVTIVIQAMTNMPRIGVGEYFGNILIVTVVRELGPFFTALVVIGRSGSALAAYIGNMRVTREISALEVMGIDPVHFMVVPAAWGLVVSMVCLSVYFDVVGLVGGLLVAHATGVTSNIPFGIFAAKVVQALTVRDIVISLAKSIVFGGVVAMVSCHYGLAVKTIRNVPQASIKSVVVSMAAMIIVNIAATLVVYLYA